MNNNNNEDFENKFEEILSGTGAVLLQSSSEDENQKEVIKNVLFKSFKKENEIIDEVVSDVFVFDPKKGSKTRNSKVS